MARSARACPTCGATVTPFAAGCAVCGMDLERWRRESATRKRWPQLPAVSLGTPTYLTGNDSALIAVLSLTALMMPILCVVLAGFGARERHLEGRETARNIVLAVGTLALAMMFVPVLRFGLLVALFS